MSSFFNTPIEYLKGVGPQRAALLNKELAIFTYADLIQHYPFRYEDRTRFYKISEIMPDLPYVQVIGMLRHVETRGAGRKKRLVAYLTDDTGELELVWFSGIQWAVKKLKTGVEYVAFGKPNQYGRKINIAHPELELSSIRTTQSRYLQPVYPVTEKLKQKFLDSKAIGKLQKQLLKLAYPHFPETLPKDLIDRYKLMAKKEAMVHIHFPADNQKLTAARFRLKFEEFFYIQLRLLKLRLTRIDKFRGKKFENTSLLTHFYEKHLPFELTKAQKKVIREIYRDMKSGHQMNRLLQGDVGSGKTIVSFICMLIVISSKRQAALMAPTEILAQQHFQGLKPFADMLELNIALLTGSTKASERKPIHAQLQSGEMHILIGTHALLEDKVQFKDLGLAIVDEQHRFGVAQRAKLWQKNEDYFPHILVMTATPIPRTLAMTLYGDLDVSVIDELPAGRKEIQTFHKFDSARLWVFGFMKKQIEQGRQVYVVYPLIEESEKLDLKHLTDGYEAIQRAFPEYQISIVHGKMKADDKAYEMKRFMEGQTKIMVATTVIEVGVDVPNATVMVIENAERFGLAQLHQLRGRVGRGADQSYCVLMSDYKLSKESKQRLGTMVRTNNGFEIAEADLKLRGPGDLMGTQQSGILDLLIADIGKDGQILQIARDAAKDILEQDPKLERPDNHAILTQVRSLKKSVVNWSRIS
jgi:ATP-dependent DNA helicase RecG